ncbi:uncharacterized protein LOC143348387 [Colletes latitarsis]|uniref:uncharacterized protein LOC143348387 n=1 Tax=Colletes latitarsis TaxID=2605962 RepID=UPI004036B149
MHSFLVSLIMDLILIVDNQDDFSDNVYLTLEVFISCWKMRSLILNRANYAILVDMLEEEPLSPMNLDEVEIRTKFDNFAQRNAIAYTLSLIGCATCMVATSIFADFRAGRLAYRGWIPYNYSSFHMFTITYVYQATSITVATFYNIAVDCLFSGLLIHVYCQFEILQNRLENIMKEGIDSAKQCARHHNYIYKFATTVNREFKTIIFIQFLVSTSIMCIELYQLTQRDLDTRYIVSVVYTSCALMQILYYCWYGNEVKLKSLEVTDAVMGCNWTSLNDDDKKILLMIMKRAEEPVEFTSIYLVVLNLESFMILLKTSYSTYNLLQQKRSTMRLLRSIFTILALCGCSRPLSWTSPIKKCLYTVYTSFVLIMVHSLVISQILDIAFNVDNQNDFSENFYLTLGVFISCCKLCTLLLRRDNYATMVQTLQKEPFLPTNTDEIEILARFEKWAEFATMVNKEFETIVLIQFLVSMSILCFDLYRFSQTEQRTKLMEMILYAICTLMQILYYCWYGNEVRVKRALSSVGKLNVNENRNAVQSLAYVSIKKDIFANTKDIEGIYVKLTMGILRRMFMLLTICGCSRPTSWTSPTKKFLYNVYTIFVFLTIHALVITQILDLVFIVDNQDDFSDNFYVTLAMIITCVKMCNMLITRKNIGTLIDTLQREPFLPMDVEEFEIRTQYDNISDLCISFAVETLESFNPFRSNEKGNQTYVVRQLYFRNNTMTYIYAIECYIIWMCLVTLILEFENRKLVFRAWLPFDYTSVLGFSFAIGHQIISILICSASNIACDSLFSGLLIHIYSQFEILGYRLRHIERDNDDSVKQCVRYHKHIYKFAKMVNEQFEMIVFIQFLTSLSTVCFDLYRLTQKEIGSESVDILLFASVTFMQIYYYCWYGNEVKLKSLEVSGMVFESDWTYLNNKTKRTLLMIMRRATVPIEFTSLYLVTVNIETFKALLKSAYSAYNVLQCSQ